LMSKSAQNSNVLSTLPKPINNILRLSAIAVDLPFANRALSPIS